MGSPFAFSLCVSANFPSPPTGHPWSTMPEQDPPTLVSPATTPDPATTRPSAAPVFHSDPTYSNVPRVVVTSQPLIRPLEPSATPVTDTQPDTDSHTEGSDFIPQPVALSGLAQRSATAAQPPNTDAPPAQQTVPNPFASNASRDALLRYAYHLYNSPNRPIAGLTAMPLVDTLPTLTHGAQDEVYRLCLLPLLASLRILRADDLPVLLLLSCTYHALGEFESCLQISQEMLNINPHYVEAMNNVGTTMKALGRNEQAYEWWWRAIQSRPTYWDAIDNILNFLFALAHNARDGSKSAILYERALDVCIFVQGKVLGSDGRLLLPVAAEDLPRLQKVFLTSGTILGMNPSSSMTAVRAYFRGIELMISPPPAYTSGVVRTTRELILAMFLAMFLLQTPGDGHLPPELAQSLNLPQNVSCLSLIQSKYDLFEAVQSCGDEVLRAILRLGRGALPFMLLAPEQTARLPSLLFPYSTGVLPAICIQGEDGQLQPPADLRRHEANLMTSTILLPLAKRYQDLPANAISIPGFSGTFNVNHALSIMFYYLALSLAPSPSTYNNMGIVLSTILATTPYTDPQGSHSILTGTSLAQMYYTMGLQLDPAHPHLLTNLGSLHKDQGNLEVAIQLYSKALAVKPDFDIALANMGNAIKDNGRAWEALEYYRRAVELNPNLPEPVCGLMNAMASVCDWRGRTCYTDEYGVDEDGSLLEPTSSARILRPGLMQRVVSMCERQLDLAYTENIRAVSAGRTVDDWIHAIQLAFGRPLREDEYSAWSTLIGQFYGPLEHSTRRVNEGGFVMRLLTWLQPRLQRRWYVRAYGDVLASDGHMSANPAVRADEFILPALPRAMSSPALPSLLPFNTFVYPLPPRMIRLISHRNALWISFTALSQPWLPRHVYPPPPPPVDGVLNIGYVSNDVNNHPLSHLMQSVFGLHDRSRFKVFMYTSSPWDGTAYRPKISSDVDLFVDASKWSSERIVKHITDHKIHVLINLGGYTKGARNDVFAARPCPVQLQLMGYPGSLGAGWCDYLVSDPIASPREQCAAEVWRRRRESGHVGDARSLDLDADLDPEGPGEEWVYSEKFIYMPHTFMVTDHKQSFRMDENMTPEERAQVPVDVCWRKEELRRQETRQLIFPDIPQNVVIFANFNQLYKIDPGIFAIWLRILNRVPNSILWLLRFPAAGEEHLLRTAKQWASDEIASRIRFTDVARKEVHVHRGRVADLCLDTVECNAHTIAADIIWPGTPFITFPKHSHKMCSRVAASMANATGFGDEMIVGSLQEYEERAVALANSIRYVPETTAGGTTLLRGQGELMRLRRNLFLNRDRMPLFDTVRWTHNIEKAYWEAWRRWVQGTQFELSDEWEASQGPEKESGCIWVQDDDPVEVVRYD